MDQSELEQALATALPSDLARDLASEFTDIRRDAATETLGRAAPGKFVESIVQSLQALEQAGTYDAHPDVDKYLKGLESRASSLPDGLRICASRTARAMYALRSKRSIVHKGEIDPSFYDLRFLYAGAQWILAEILALAQGLDPQRAGTLVAQVQLPVGELVEAVGDLKVVHGKVTIREEVLILLSSYYPEAVPTSQVHHSLERRNKRAVSNEMRALWKEKLLHRGDSGMVLSEPGLRAAVEVANAHLD